MNIMEFKDLSVEYFRDRKTVRALRGVSLGVLRGETLAVVGESGCGKTTLALSAMRLIFPEEGRITAGSITCYNDDILAFPQRRLRAYRGRDVSIVFQDPSSALNPVLTIGEQLAETVTAHRPGTDGNTLHDIVEAALNEVKLADTARISASYPHQLSGGQKQRAAIAMAIINRPKVLIADEPTTALDMTVQKEILDMLDGLKKSLALTVLLITHDIPLAKERCGHVAVMYAGEIVEYGAAGNILGNPKHPYTAALIASVPRLGARAAHRCLLHGQPPDMSALPAGCAFRPRCDKAMDICAEKEPDNYDTGTSSARCFLYGRDPK